MTQEKTSKSTLNQVITMGDICARFDISPRHCRNLIRKGIIEAKPKAFRKRPHSKEVRAVDFFVSRAEFRRIEQNGFVYSPECEASK